MLPKEKDMIFIQGYKHDKSLHRTWSQAYVIESNPRRIVAITDRSWVIESDGRRWLTREPAICFFYPDRWYNVICMIRKSGIHYYCNLASPSVYDEEALKYIDYDLDVKVNPKFEYTILDEDEYNEHSQEMEYGDRLDHIIHRQMNKLLVDIQLQNSPFDHFEIKHLYQKYQTLLRMRDEEEEHVSI